MIGKLIGRGQQVAEVLRQQLAETAARQRRRGVTRQPAQQAASTQDAVSPAVAAPGTAATRGGAMTQAVVGSLAVPERAPTNPFSFAGGLVPRTAPVAPSTGLPAESTAIHRRGVDGASEPARGSREATDAAARRLQDARQARIDNGNPLLQHEYDEAVRGAEQNLHEAVQAEIEARLENAGGRATIDDVETELFDRYADSAAVQSVVRGAVDAARSDYRIESVADHVASAPDAATGLDRLASRWDDLSPVEQSRLLQDERVQGVLDAAVEEANAPLEELQNGVVYFDEERGQFHVTFYDTEGNVQSPLLDALRNLDELTGELPPELAAEIVERALPDYEQVLAARQGLDDESYVNLDTMGHSEQELLTAALPHLAAIANRVAGAEGGRELVGRLVDGPYGYLTFAPTVNASYDQFVSLVEDGTGPALLIELARRDGLLMGGASPERAVLGGIEERRGNYEQAREAREAADQSLMAMLSELDGLLTEEEQQIFINNYRQEHAEIYDAEVEAAEQLAEILTENADFLDELALNDPEAAQQIFEAYEELARSPLPAAATEWAARVTQDDSPLAEVYAPFAEDIVEKILEPGLPGTLAQYQAEADGDAEAALDRFEALFDDFKKARSVYRHVTGFTETLDKAQDYIDAMREAAAGNPQPLRELLTSPTELNQLSDFGAAVAAASLAFGLLNLSEQQGFDLVRAVGGVGRDGLDLAVRAIGSLETSGRLASSSRLVAAANFAQVKVLPRLAVALSALATIDSLTGFLEDPTLENGLQVLASATALVGSALMLNPATAPVGAILLIGATIGSLILGRNGDERPYTQEDLQRLLTQTLTETRGDTEEVRETAARMIANLNALHDIGYLLDVPPGALYELARDYPDALGQDTYYFIYASQALGVGGRDLLPFLQELEQQGRLDEFLDVAYQAVTNSQIGGAPDTIPGTDEFSAKVRDWIRFEAPEIAEAALHGLTGRLEEHRELIAHGFSDNDVRIIQLESEINARRRDLDARIRDEIEYRMSIPEPNGETLSFDEAAAIVLGAYPEGSTAREEVEASLERLRNGGGLDR